jgi:TolB-like protein
MVHVFGDHRLDVSARELWHGATLVRLEPQVFDLLCLLVENRERVVTREEIIARIWGGRFVSDAAVSSRIKSARQAIGDDGERQCFIRTHHGVGFRFVGDATIPRPGERAAAEALAGKAVSRPSIAVLPFQMMGADGQYIADALPHDLIVELSRLRWLTVIARGSSFHFRGLDATADRVKAALGVRYLLAGSVDIQGRSLAVMIELSDTDDGAIVWSEIYRGRIDAVHDIRAGIAAAVVAALELQIPIAERAAALFQQAIDREPSFARAHAGLSFAHFESAFLRFASDREKAAALARHAAETSLALDPLDPFCNLVMGRAAWLTGDLDAALPWLDRAIELNPNYAQGKYSSAWTRTLLGEGATGRALVDAATALSPLDPLLYGMLGVRAFSHIVLDEPAEAACWGERAARAPRAHPLIALIAAVGHGLNGDGERAKHWAHAAAARQPGIDGAAFFQAFPFRDVRTRSRIERTLRMVGL